MKTVVLQSYRTHGVEAWVSRCLSSVKAWTERSGYAYEFIDDSIFDLCGPEYLARVGDNKLSITNLARLEAVRAILRAGADRAIWLDADVFVFAPEQLSIDVTLRYAFCKEAWISVGRWGRMTCHRVINNAAFVFTKDEPDLDFLISTIRHVVMHRDVRSNYQVGVWLLTGLERTLGFGLLRTIGLLSPDVVRAILEDNVRVLRRQMAEFADPMFAANLTLSKAPAGDQMMRAMDILEASLGHVLNKYVSSQSVETLGHWAPNPPPSPFDRPTAWPSGSALLRGGLRRLARYGSSPIGNWRRDRSGPPTDVEHAKCPDQDRELASKTD